MKHVIALSALLAVPFAFASSAVEQCAFSFAVQVDRQPVAKMRIEVPLGTSHRLQATDHLWLEVQVPAQSTLTSVATVKLIDDSSGQPVVRDSIQSTGPFTSELNVRYGMCDGRVISYIGHSAEKAVSCEGEK